MPHSAPASPLAVALFPSFSFCDLTLVWSSQNKGNLRSLNPGSNVSHTTFEWWSFDFPIYGKQQQTNKQKKRWTVPALSTRRECLMRGVDGCNLITACCFGTTLSSFLEGLVHAFHFPVGFFLSSWATIIQISFSFRAGHMLYSETLPCFLHWKSFSVCISCVWCNPTLRCTFLGLHSNPSSIGVALYFPCITHPPNGCWGALAQGVGRWRWMNGEAGWV